jgi:hypothetical protein
MAECQALCVPGLSRIRFFGIFEVTVASEQTLAGEHRQLRSASRGRVLVCPDDHHDRQSS